MLGRGPTARNTGEAHAERGGVANTGIVEGDINTYTIYMPRPVTWPVRVGVVPPEADCYQPRIVTGRLSAITTGARWQQLASMPAEARTDTFEETAAAGSPRPRGDRLRCATVRQLPLLRLVALALTPGAAGTLVYIALSRPIDAIGLPRIDALLVAILVAILPIEVGILLAARGRARAAVEPLIPYRVPIPVRSWLWLVPALVIAAVLGSGLLMFVDTAIAGGLFSWLPGWYLRPIDLDLARRYSTAAWTLSLVAYMVLNGLAGPIVEELYFRGFLLPRMDRFGRWAPLLNATAFSLYHFWSPWQLLSRIAAVTPFVYAVRWRRNVYLGMAVHCSLNLIGGTLVVVNVVRHL